MNVTPLGAVLNLTEGDKAALRKQFSLSVLTERQRQIWYFIYAKLAGTGHPPTVREIARGMGIASPNGVECHLKLIERKGKIARGPGNSRRSRLTIPGLTTEAPAPVTMSSMFGG